MPSKHTSGTATRDIPSYPTFEDRIGENPARFLCTDLNVWPLIRGLRSFERASAWLAVARAEGVDERVVEALENTKAALREEST